MPQRQVLSKIFSTFTFFTFTFFTFTFFTFTFFQASLFERLSTTPLTAADLGAAAQKVKDFTTEAIVATSKVGLPYGMWSMVIPK